MRLFTLVLAGLLLLIQYPLWLGKGGWLRAWDLDRQLDVQRAGNDKLGARNAAMAAEVRDLRQGLLAVEERARYELGMIRDNEIFVQLAAAPAAPGGPGAGTSAGPGGAGAPAATAPDQLIEGLPGKTVPSSAKSNAASKASKR